MDKLREAARQVVANGVQGTYAKYYSVPPADFEALREALAEPTEREPVEQPVTPRNTTRLGPAAVAIMALIEQLAFEEDGRYFIADDSEAEVTEIVLQIRNLLATPVQQAEQEPVACPVCCNGYLVKHTEEYCNSCGSVCVSPQTIQENVANKKAAPVRTKELTDDEIHKCDRATVTRQDFARAVIAAYKAKNRLDK